MLFGSKSEKVLRRIEQLELQIEDLEVATVVEEIQAMAPTERPHRRAFSPAFATVQGRDVKAAAGRKQLYRR